MIRMGSNLSNKIIKYILKFETTFVVLVIHEQKNYEAENVLKIYMIILREAAPIIITLTFKHIFYS